MSSTTQISRCVIPVGDIAVLNGKLYVVITRSKDVELHLQCKHEEHGNERQNGRQLGFLRRHSYHYSIFLTIRPLQKLSKNPKMF